MTAPAKRSLFLLALLVCLSASPTARPASEGLRASVVKVDITPDSPQWLLGYAARRSTGVHDRIYHRIVALDDGREQFFLISTDICLVSPAEYDAVAAALEREAGIKPLSFWWACTHTHSAPEVGPPGLPAAFLGDRYRHEPDRAYTREVERKLIDGVKEARAKLEPARLGLGWGISMANINRRARDIDGQTSLGMNPDGPADRRIGLLRLDRADGRPLALIANYAIHGTVLGGKNLEISGDAPGIVADYVEEKLGAPMLFVNGAAGDIAPIYSVAPDFKSGHLGQFRVLLGDRILEANRRLTTSEAPVRLSLDASVVETPMKPALKWPDELASYARDSGSATGLVRIPIRWLRIGDEAVIWAAPLELFCEVAMGIRDRSPFPYTMYFGYCNGWLGYLLTESELGFGGYESTVTAVTAQAAADLTRAVLGRLHGMRR